MTREEAIALIMASDNAEFRSEVDYLLDVDREYPYDAVDAALDALDRADVDLVEEVRGGAVGDDPVVEARRVDDRVLAGEQVRELAVRHGVEVLEDELDARGEELRRSRLRQGDARDGVPAPDELCRRVVAEHAGRTDDQDLSHGAPSRVRQLFLLASLAVVRRISAGRWSPARVNRR